MTLTYPAEWPADDRRWKAHLKAVWKRIKRRWPGAAAVWRLEFQRRGAPHYHLLLYGVPLYELAVVWKDGQRWLDWAWYEVVGSGDVRHLRAGVNTAPVRSFEGVMHYAAKYITKPDSDGEGRMVAEPVSKADEWTRADAFGRYWGVLGRECMPWGTRLLLRLVGPESWNLRRALVRASGVKVRSRKGLTIFASGDVYARLIEGGHLLGEYRGNTGRVSGIEKL